MEYNIALSGSSMLYPCFVGVLLALKDNGVNIKGVSGTSGGSIIAAALASGYEIDKQLVNLVKDTLPIKHNLIDPSLWTLWTRWGLISGDRIQKMFERYFVNSMKESKIPTYIVAANVSASTTDIFSHIGTPDANMSQVVRASMSIPLVFAPTVINDEHYVDGGITLNLAMDVFEDQMHVIGVRFTPASTRKKKRKLRDIKQFFLALIDTILESNMAESAEDVEEAAQKNVIYIKTKHNGLNFAAGDADVDDMINDGYQAALAFLKRKRLAK